MTSKLLLHVMLLYGLNVFFLFIDISSRWESKDLVLDSEIMLNFKRILSDSNTKYGA